MSVHLSVPTFESLDLSESYFWYAGTRVQNIQVKFVCQGHRVKVKVTWSKKVCLCILFACRLPSTEKHLVIVTVVSIPACQVYLRAKYTCVPSIPACRYAVKAGIVFSAVCQCQSVCVSACVCLCVCPRKNYSSDFDPT